LCDISTATPLVEEALAIIRNITCVTNNEILNTLDDCGEDRLLGLLLSHLTRASTHEINATQVSSYRSTSFLNVTNLTFESVFAGSLLSQQHRYSWRGIATRYRFSYRDSPVPDPPSREFAFYSLFVFAKSDSFVPSQDNPSPRVRTASLWTINNLVYRRTPYSASPAMSTLPRQRRPQEIVEKLRALGLEGKLKSLERDQELDVRERVRDIKEAMMI